MKNFERRVIILVGTVIVKTFDSVAAAIYWVDRNKITDYEILPVALPLE